MIEPHNVTIQVENTRRNTDRFWLVLFDFARRHEIPETIQPGSIGMTTPDDATVVFSINFTHVRHRDAFLVLWGRQSRERVSRPDQQLNASLRLRRYLQEGHPVTAYKFALAVEIRTIPYENILALGFELSEFAHAHPDLDYIWEEARYVDDEGYDENGDPAEIDNVEIFPKDRNWAVMMVRFQTAADREIYEAYRRARWVEVPQVAMIQALGLTPLR